MISVILPVYNGENTLLQTIISIEDQTFQEFELLVCDDGSTDKSIDILKRQQNKCIIILKNIANRGLGYTLNKLIDNVHPKSKYIAIAEQDDIYYNNRLKLQFDYMESHTDIGLVSGIADHWNGEKITTKFPGLLVEKKQYPKGIELFKLNYLEQCKVVNSCMMIRKSVHLQKNLTFSTKYPSISVDWDYILRFSLVGKIAGINQSLVRLDRRSERSSLTTNKKLQFRIARKLIKDFFNEFPNLISQNDFKYALATQGYLEAINKKNFYRLLYTLKIIMIDPSKKRKKQKLKLLIKNLLNSLEWKYFYLRRTLLKDIAWILSYKRFQPLLYIDNINELIKSTESYLGYGYYNRISMQQKEFEIYKLCKLIKDREPKIILEIGTKKGGTLFLWSRISNANQIISVDLPGGKFGGGYPIEKQRLYKRFVVDKSTKMHLIQGDSHSDDTLNAVKNILGQTKIDFLFIDGDHTYNGVKLDFEMYRPLMNNNSIIAFHDIVTHSNYQSCEVDKLWNEVKGKYNYKEFIENPNQTSMGIGILFIE